MLPHYGPTKLLIFLCVVGVTVFHIYNEEETSLFSMLPVAFGWFQGGTERRDIPIPPSKTGRPIIAIVT